MLGKYAKNVSLKGCQIIRQPEVPTTKICLDQISQITRTVEQTCVKENSPPGSDQSKEFFFNFNNFIYLYIFGRVGSSLLHGLFSGCGDRGLPASCGVWASHGGDSLQSTGSGACRPQWLRFLGSGARVQ